jgi:hypothetical protein
MSNEEMSVQVTPVIGIIKKALDAEKTGKTSLEEAKTAKALMRKMGFDTTPADEKIAELESTVYVGDDLVSEVVEDFNAVTSWNEFKLVIAESYRLLFSSSNVKCAKSNGKSKVVHGCDVAAWCLQQNHNIDVANLIAGTLGCGTSIMKTKYMNPSDNLYCIDRTLPDEFRKQIEEAYEKISSLV